MENNKNAVLALGVTGLVAGGLLWLGTRKAEASGDNQNLGLYVYDQYGRLIASSNALVNSLNRGVTAALPTSLMEGDTVYVVAKVTNTSYKVLGGVNTPWANTLKVTVTGASAPFSELNVSKDFSFAASEQKTIDSTTWSSMAYTIPVGKSGSGTITLKLTDSTGSVTLGTVTSSSITVTSAPVTKAGTIEITSAPATTYSEGDTITGTVNVTNTSYKTLSSGAQVYVSSSVAVKFYGSGSLAGYITSWITLVANPSKLASFSYTIPAGTVGVGKISCELQIGGVTVTTIATANITVEAVPIIPGGTIVFL